MPDYADPSKNLRGPSNLADPSKNLVAPTNLADPSKNLTAPNNLAPVKPAVTQPEWDAHFAPRGTLSAAVQPQGLPLPPSPFGALQPKQQTLQQLASGGENHQQAWMNGNRAPQKNQSPFSLDATSYLRNTPADYSGLPVKQNPNLDEQLKLYGWGSGLAAEA